MSVTWDPVAFWARVQPDRVALRMGDETWTYGRLEEAVSEAALSLYEQGLVAGEHVSIEFGAEEALHFAATLHALHRAELLPVPISQRLTEPERVVLRQRAQVDVALTATPEPSAKRGKHSGTPPDFERRLDAPAAILFTSGTEGTPRAVVLTHGNFFWSALASARLLGVRADDLWLSCVPLHHVGGLSVLTRSASYGTAALIHDRFDAAAVIHAIDEEGVTLVSLVPPMLERLLEARAGRPFPETLRAALIGGGPAPLDLLRRAASLGLRALPTYGMTETASQVATLSPRDWPDGLETVGRPLPFLRVEVRDAKGKALGPNEEGEILVRGPMVAEAYFDDRERSATAFEGRWFRTGDFGAWDERGRLRVLDRRSDRMVVGGENVSPLEVETVLAAHPSVAEVCVIALEAGSWGHEVVAAVVCRPGRSVTLDELKEEAGRTLASFKLPRRLWVVDRLPRNASGKLLRGEIRGRLAQEMAEQHRA
ncbi:MAG TPA: AMP-binding protein [Candidatus Polarisedimenticolia bacterium]|nr:AMP-binding protein [Candidatus Polarisedimenticolia bacterium]